MNIKLIGKVLIKGAPVAFVAASTYMDTYKKGIDEIVDVMQKDYDEVKKDFKNGDLSKDEMKQAIDDIITTKDDSIHQLKKEAVKETVVETTIQAGIGLVGFGISKLLKGKYGLLITAGEFIVGGLVNQYRMSKKLNKVVTDIKVEEEPVKVTEKKELTKYEQFVKTHGWSIVLGSLAVMGTLAYGIITSQRAYINGWYDGRKTGIRDGFEIGAVANILHSLGVSKEDITSSIYIGKQGHVYIRENTNIAKDILNKSKELFNAFLGGTK